MNVSGTHAGGFAERLGDQVTPEETAEAIPLDPPTSEEVGTDIEELLDSVHRRGERLLERRTFSSVQEYREAVQAFLRRVVPDASQLETHESSHSILFRKRYTLLGEINRKVDRLVRGVLQTQAQQVEILSRLEEIEGLLVDLLH